MRTEFTINFNWGRLLRACSISAAAEMHGVPHGYWHGTRIDSLEMARRTISRMVADKKITHCVYFWMNLLQFNLTTVRKNVLHHHFHRLVEQSHAATTERWEMVIDICRSDVCAPWNLFFAWQKLRFHGIQNKNRSGPNIWNRRCWMEIIISIDRRATWKDSNMLS